MKVMLYSTMLPEVVDDVSIAPVETLDVRATWDNKTEHGWWITHFCNVMSQDVAKLHILVV